MSNPLLPRTLGSVASIKEIYRDRSLTQILVSEFQGITGEEIASIIYSNLGSNGTIDIKQMFGPSHVVDLRHVKERYEHDRCSSTRRLYFPSEGRRATDFITLKSIVLGRV
jgi:hypothetical protein